MLIFNYETPIIMSSETKCKLSCRAERSANCHFERNEVESRNPHSRNSGITVTGNVANIKTNCNLNDKPPQTEQHITWLRK